MPAKRKVETTVTEDSESAKALPTTADMADVLRKKPIKRRKRSKKKHPVWKHIDIDFDATHLMPEAAPFPELPRELRDEIYHWLWIDAAQIRQRYKGWHYPVTYGEQDAVGFQDVSSSKARWLLTSKQMMLEGLAQFHRHSIWIFGSGCKTERSASIFPLITPALVHEQHLYVGGTRDDWTDNNVGWLGFQGPQHGLWFFRYADYMSEGSSKHARIITTPPWTDKMVNLMMTTTDAHTTVQKIKVHLRIDDRRLQCHRCNHYYYYYSDILFDFSIFDGLAAHAQLQTLEVTAQIHKRGFLPTENLDTMVANLMTELEIVGKAVVPGGISIQTHPAPGWPMDRGVKFFQFTVNKA